MGTGFFSRIRMYVVLSVLDSPLYCSSFLMTVSVQIFHFRFIYLFISFFCYSWNEWTYLIYIFLVLSKGNILWINCNSFEFLFVSSLFLLLLQIVHRKLTIIINISFIGWQFQSVTIVYMQRKVKSDHGYCNHFIFITTITWLR